MLLVVKRTLGYFLKQMRTLRGFPQCFVADSLKTTCSTISKYENDLLEPNVQTLKQISSLYKTSLDRLTGYYYENHSSRLKGKKTFQEIQDILKELSE